MKTVQKVKEVKTEEIISGKDMGSAQSKDLNRITF
jgi:hypothetical protein